MGTEATAYIPGGGSITTDPILSAKFAEAAEQVRELTGRYDGFIEIGSLDCNICNYLVKQRLGFLDRSEGFILRPEKLRAIYETAEWPDPDSVPQDELWAYWSARKFLEVCIQQGLGLEFS